MKVPGLYRVMRGIIGLGLGFYFRRIEQFRADRVPATGPVLFVSNHPSSLTDSFVIGASVPRKVSFVATVQLFQFKPLKWLLTNCGVIPINRLRDDPRGMRSVADTFEACYRVLEQGEAVAIFPEGITHDDPQLKTVKTGAARMGLELEHRHGGKIGLQIVPVGLTFSAKEMYRSEVLVHFGEPIRSAEYLPGYEDRKKEQINELNSRIEQSIQALILHLPKLERLRVVESVKKLYLDRMQVGQRSVAGPVSPRAEELLLTQRIAAAVDHVYDTQPERAKAFVLKLEVYERWLKRLQLSDADVSEAPRKRNLAWQSLVWTALAILGLPIAIYGWIHRLLPALVVYWAIRKFANVKKHKAQTSTAAIVAGLVSFGFFYGLYTWIAHRLFGWPVSLWYGLSLPVAGLIAHYYVQKLGNFGASLRNMFILIRAPAAAKRLIRLRSELIAEIEAARPEINAR